MTLAHTAPTRSERALGIALAAIAGLGLAVQSRINGELGARLHDGVLAALISFGTGLVLLAVIVPSMPKVRGGFAGVRTAVRDRSLRPWHLLGGVAGATFVASQALTVPSIGVAMFTVAMVTGQMFSGLAVDKVGLGPAGSHPLTLPRVLGAGLTVVAVIGAMSGQLDGTTALWLLVLPLLAGCGIAVQQAVNGRVRAAADSAITATMINFGTGTIALGIAWAVSLAVRGGPEPLPGTPWLYVGGPIGIVVIGVTAAGVRWTGVLLFGLTAIAGQLVGAVLVDLLAPAADDHLDTATLIGAGLTLIAVGIANLPARRRAG
ncbi:transporter family-2 protein [Herbihabitans rhizosphaerae]|uniref:Transporter family-2 protein n=1 Tax=Herbihabitans rhizosphaerae TaxID=1872711 RepID=A0A4Q7KMT1_9PSEU|nr:DMT family transporter [Herbihabitans rhizosphaerae]RZS36911.1 transporter family-2 protein [Herbihabitans rhizosphaerae]